MEREETLDVIHDSLYGVGARPVKGRETRKEPCQCCLVNPKGGKTDPKNRICTTKGAIGTLNDREEEEWCSKIEVAPKGGNGRCERIRSIRLAAAECRQGFLVDEDNKDVMGFFNYFIPKFIGTTDEA